VYVTYADLVDHIVLYAGADPTAGTVMAAKNAAQKALLAVSGRTQWLYYNTLCLVNTTQPYSTGTITYTESTRTVTLAGGTWPTWAAYGYIVIANATYAIASRDSATQLTLNSQTTPGDDVAAGTAYILRQDTFQLPADFQEASSAMAQPGIFNLIYVTNATAMTGRNANVGTGRPQYFAIVPDPFLPQRMAARIWPASGSVYRVQFTYRRKMTPPVYLRESPGLVSSIASSTTVSGTTDTNFTSAMAGAAIRFGSDAKDSPTGIFGDNPAQMELLIQSVTNANTLVASAVADQTLATRKYVITSLLDCEPGAMYDYISREAEKQYRLIARVKANPEESQAYQNSLRSALEEDQTRWFGRTTAGPVAIAGVFDFVTVIPST
jgi:hypothetical protein